MKNLRKLAIPLLVAPSIALAGSGDVVVPEMPAEVCETRNVPLSRIEVPLSRFRNKLPMESDYDLITRLNNTKIEIRDKAMSHPRSAFLFEYDEEFDFIRKYLLRLINENRTWWNLRTEYVEVRGGWGGVRKKKIKVSKDEYKREIIDDLLAPRICGHLEAKADILAKVYEESTVELKATPLITQGGKPLDPYYHYNKVSRNPGAYQASYLYGRFCDIIRGMNNDMTSQTLELAGYVPLPVISSVVEGSSFVNMWDGFVNDEKVEIGNFKIDLVGVAEDLAQKTLKEVISGKNINPFDVVKDYLIGGAVKRGWRSIVEITRMNNPLLELPEQEWRELREEYEKELAKYRVLALTIPAINYECLCKDNGEYQRELEIRTRVIQQNLEELKYSYEPLETVCVNGNERDAIKAMKTKHGVNPTRTAFGGGGTYCAHLEGWKERDELDKMGKLKPTLQSWRKLNIRFMRDPKIQPTGNYLDPNFKICEERAKDVIDVSCPTKYKCVDSIDVSKYGEGGELYKKQVCLLLQFAETGNYKYLNLASNKAPKGINGFYWMDLVTLGVNVARGINVSNNLEAKARRDPSYTPYLQILKKIESCGR